MGRLADDWQEQRQTCIDVLCAYLRMPFGETSESTLPAEAEVRRSIVQLFIAHWLTERAEWLPYNFDLRRADIYDLNLSGANPPTGEVQIDGAHLFGRTVLHNDFERGVNLKGAVVHGSVSIRAQQLTGYEGLRICKGGSLFVRINPNNTHTNFRKAVVEGDLTIRLPNYGDGKSVIRLEEVAIASTGRLLLEMLDKHVEGNSNPHREDQWASIVTEGWTGDGKIYVDKCLMDSSHLHWDATSIPTDHATVRTPTVRRLSAFKPRLPSAQNPQPPVSP